jgi:hypothetical protein
MMILYPIAYSPVGDLIILFPIATSSRENKKNFEPKRMGQNGFSLQKR